jgi:two-component system, cell cycle response regulator
MTARILVVDDIDVNVRLLEAKLLAEYYDVITANNGESALAITKEQSPDLILLDVMMPGMDGYEVCERLKADPETAHIPVVMVTALNDMSDRVRGLEAGADDFLTKPVNDVALFARIRSLVRLKRASDEWRTREATFIRFGADAENVGAVDTGEKGNILLVMSERDAPQHIVERLEDRDHETKLATSLEEAKSLALNNEFDLILVNDSREDGDALRLCSQLRSDERTRQTPILLMVFEGDEDRFAKALEIGVNDYVVKPVDRDELHARTRGQIRRKRYEDELRSNYHRSLTAALTDDLTGLNNRRFLEAHFEEVVGRLAPAAKLVSLMLLDVDKFKEVNDRYGHAVGDVVLQGVSGRMQTSLRGFDTAVRYGGEEFIVLMPNTPPADALAAAERLCRTMNSKAFSGSGDSGEVIVTVSIGLVTGVAGEAALDELIHMADGALYEAKNSGRNRVVVANGDKPQASDTGSEPRQAQTNAR